MESPRFGLMDQRIRPTLARPLPNIFRHEGYGPSFESPSRRIPLTGAVPMPAVIPYKEGGLVDACVVFQNRPRQETVI